MADKLIFELVSPSALLASEEVDMVVVPGADGDFGVLAGHAPVLSNLRAGVVDIHNEGQVTKSLFVEGGFAEAAVRQWSCEGGAVKRDHVELWTRSGGAPGAGHTPATRLSERAACTGGRRVPSPKSVVTRVSQNPSRSSILRDELWPAATPLFTP